MKDKRTKIIFSIVLLLSLVLVTVGVSYAFFTYIGQGSTENTITTGNLTFVYDEKNAEGNGIKLSNALPVSDELGKQQSGNNNIFDFQVVATTQGAPIYYEVLAEKGEASTLSEEVIKVYLTTVDGIEEAPVDITLVNGAVATFNQLPVSQIPQYSRDKTLYQGTISKGETSFTQQFKLRMWLSEEATEVTDGEWDYNNQTFTVKVNVYASNEVLPEAKELYTDATGANLPKLVKGMIPVKYDGSKWVKADMYDEWYDYDKQEWANAVTVTETNRETYMNAEAGTEIPMNDINTMWVWIPRYEYQYTNLGDQYAGGTQEQPGEIKVNFLSGKSTQSSDPSNYKVHPAFTFGEKELTGLWYAKFETSKNEDCNPTYQDNYSECNSTKILPIIKPGIYNWKGLSASTAFQVSRLMQTKNYEYYGFSNTNNYDIHMSKNNEWGSVAYLSQSKYGKYGNKNYSGSEKEIYRNDFYNSESRKTMTGCTNGMTSGQASTECNYFYDELQGIGASTSGTIYGIYDMNAGSPEYVMAVLKDNNGNPRSGSTKDFNSEFNGTLSDNTSYTEGIEFPSSKYYNLYQTQWVTSKACGGVCYGDALSEVSGWYHDAITFISIGNPWLVRGGAASYGSEQSGIFATGVTAGQSADVTFRITIAP